MLHTPRMTSRGFQSNKRDGEPQSIQNDPTLTAERHFDARNRGLGNISLDKIEVALSFGFAKIGHYTVVDAMCIDDDLALGSGDFSGDGFMATSAARPGA